MRSKRRTQITVEMHQTLTLRRRAPLACAWCAACAARVALLWPEEAAVLAGTSTRTIYRWIETGRLHFTETPEGFSLVCVASLPTAGWPPGPRVEVDERG